MKMLVICVSCSLLFPVVATAEVLFESGTLGQTGISIDEIGGGPEPGGAVVSDFVFEGVRFEVNRPSITTQIGGHFVADPRFDDSFFGAIVRLDDATDYPNSSDLSTSDVLGATSLTFPNPSAEVFGELTVELEPGWYTLVFGSGLFGATGNGGMLLNNPDIGSPSYIGYQPGTGWYSYTEIGGFFNDFRFVVNGEFVPEPTSAALILIAMSLAILLSRRNFDLARS
jgi:hypothetical protein